MELSYALQNKKPGPADYTNGMQQTCRGHWFWRAPSQRSHLHLLATPSYLPRDPASDYSKTLGRSRRDCLGYTGSMGATQGTLGMSPVESLSVQEADQQHSDEVRHCQV